MQAQGSDELWAEWDRSMATGHVDIQHSTERMSVRYSFFSRLKVTMKQILKDLGQSSEVTVKELFAEYSDAEAKKKFTTAKGLQGVKRENELASVMKWGDFLMKHGLMQAWRELEVHGDGKTAFFSITFGKLFCSLVGDNEEIAKYILNTLAGALKDKDGKWRKKILDGNVAKMKSIVKTLALQWRWAKKVFESCKTKPIMATEKMNEDFAVVETAFDATEAHRVKTDGTGKKANLHPLAWELWDTIMQVLELKHFSTFQGAEATNKTFDNMVKMDCLQELCLNNILNPWKDAVALFTKKRLPGDPGAGNGLPEAAPDDEEKEVMMELPTRKDAIKSAAKNEFQTYTETSFVRTGDPVRDRQRMLGKELTKPRNAKNAIENTDTQGLRRVTMYDPAGRSNPKWQYVKGRNPWRGKVGFQKDDFEELADTWTIMAKPEACGPGISICAGCSPESSAK